MAGQPVAFFLPVEPGERLCLFHAPAAGAAPAGGIVYVHPFAEEMNKARRMVSLQARRLAAAGRAVLQIDLLGCGDSSGEFADGRWAAWQRDVHAAAGWLRQRCGGAIGLWGLRLGASLAADVARDPAAGIDELVLWQPVANGEQFMTQFLRLHLASEMLSDGAARTGVRELRAALAGGAILEIAGYELHPELAAAIDGVKLAELVPAVGRVHWLEVSGQPAPALMPAAQRVLDAWRARGRDARVAAVAGDPFWSTPEITECTALLDATDASLKSARETTGGRG